jgi:hypothetical protein
MRIPAVTYGPGVSVGGGNFGMRIADLVTRTKRDALTALGPLQPGAHGLAIEGGPRAIQG